MGRKLLGNIRNQWMGALALFLVLTGGSAYALGGSNTVFTDDIANDTQPASGGNPAGGLVAADLRPNSVGTSEVALNSLNAGDIGAGAVGTSEHGTIPAARASATANQSIASGTETTITLDSEVFDNANVHDNVTNNSRLTAPVSGIYQINARVDWGADVGTVRGLLIRKNGGTGYIAWDTRAPLSGNNLRQNISTLASLNAGDYIELRAFQDSGTTVISAADTGISPELSMHWVSP